MSIKNSNQDCIIVLTESQKTMIDAGLKDMEDGNFLTNEEANKEIQELLE